jgi:hypothetical protein
VASHDRQPGPYVAAHGVQIVSALEVHGAETYWPAVHAVHVLHGLLVSRRFRPENAWAGVAESEGKRTPG